MWSFTAFSEGTTVVRSLSVSILSDTSLISDSPNCNIPDMLKLPLIVKDLPSLCRAISSLCPLGKRTPEYCRTLLSILTCPFSRLSFANVTVLESLASIPSNNVSRGSSAKRVKLSGISGSCKVFCS